MSKSIPIDSKRAGQQNERLILSLLRSSGGMSQTELCRRLGIISSTASTIVARLREKELVVERRGDSARRGPKPITLALNPDAFHIIAIEINPNHIFIGLFNFIGHLISKFSITLGAERDAKTIIATLICHIQTIVQQFHLKTSRCYIGITISGSVSGGIVHLSSPMGWKDVPLAEQLATDISAPIYLFSNRIRLLAEIQLEPELAQRDIVYLNVANGVGASVFSKQVLSGSSGRYGEIGHTVIDPNGPECGCGHRGCLEAHISGQALLRRIAADKQNGAQTRLLEQADSQADPETLLADWPAIAQTEPYAANLRDQTVRLIADAAAAVINAYDPHTLILGGYINALWFDNILNALKQSMPARVYDGNERTIDIRPAKAGPDALLVGVYEALMQQILCLP